MVTYRLSHCLPTIITIGQELLNDGDEQLILVVHCPLLVRHCCCAMGITTSTGIERGSPLVVLNFKILKFKRHVRTRLLNFNILN